jgi:hypothetical protein
MAITSARPMMMPPSRLHPPKALAFSPAPLTAHEARGQGEDDRQLAADKGRHDGEEAPAEQQPPMAANLPEAFDGGVAAWKTAPSRLSSLPGCELSR